MTTTSKPTPYVPPSWQLPHLLALKPGERALVVLPFELAMPTDNRLHDLAYIDGRVYCRVTRELADELGISDELGHKTLPCDAVWWSPIVKGGCDGLPVECPLGPVGSVIACRETWGQDFERVSEANPFGIRYKVEWTNEDEADEYRDWKWNSPVTMAVRNCRLFLRSTAIDLRRVDTMTSEEAAMWGCFYSDGPVSREKLLPRVAQEHWTCDHPKHPWGAPAWFINAEKLNQGV